MIQQLLASMAIFLVVLQVWAFPAESRPGVPKRRVGGGSRIVSVPSISQSFLSTQADWADPG